MLSSLEPCHHLVNLGLDGLLVILLKSILELGIDPLLGLSILIGELLSLTDHTLDVVLAKATLVIGDGDVGLLARGRLVLSSHVEHTVGIDVEGDFHLGHATWCWGDASELELAKKIVVLGAGALALVHLDEHTWLVVGVGGESLGLLGGDGGVAGDQGGHDATSSLETHGKRGNIEQEDVLVTSGATSEDVGLDGGTVGDSLIRVDGA